MSVIAAPPLPHDVVAPSRAARRVWTWGVVALAVVTLIVTGWGVGASMSTYYGSIALSMSQSWPNFLFGSLDPAGTVTLDKIPGSFWIPALFVRVFGFSAWAVVFPNALAATASAVIAAFTARRWAGPTAGLVAGAVVATTPILVAVARSNQPEMFFVLALALTAWAATKALDRRSLTWLILAGVFIAAGFQTYMLEAWMVWPALAIAYLCTRQSWMRRLSHLAIAGIISLALSLTWIIAVALVPASDRPYIGSTLSNSPWEMVFGYNGLGRFGATSDADAYRSFTPPFSGDPGVLRLMNEALAAQIGWLLPTAIVAIVALVAMRLRAPLLVFATGWFVTLAAAFSVVAGMHQFYTAALAIPMALLIGTALALAFSRGVVWAQLALPITAAVTALGISIAYGGQAFTVPVALVQCLIAAIAVLLALRSAHRRTGMPAAAALAIVAMLLTPAAWSAVTMTTPNSTNPVAGGTSTTGAGGFGGGAAAPGAAGGRGPGGGAPGGGQNAGGPRTQNDGQRGGQAGQGGGQGVSAATLAWLEEHRGTSSYLAATFGAQSAASLIIASGGESVLPIGGFGGQDPAPTLEEFQALVADGAVRYVIASDSTMGGGQTAASAGAEIRTWVTATCVAVTDADASGVYDCAG